MENRIGNLAYTEHGAGVPLVALHGAGVDHRDIESAIEAIVPPGYRRIYPDLPGMGRSTADGVRSNGDVVAELGALIDALDGPVLLLGHSYGAYLARGVAARRPESVRGLALICPFLDGADAPRQQAVRQDADAYDELEPELRQGFDEYFVIRTAATARRYRDHVYPGTLLVDQPALERIFANWSIDVGSGYGGPTLIAAGRRDSTVGYSGAAGLLDPYPLATLAVLDDAGHALLHERPDLVGALLTDWLERAGDEERSQR